MRPHTDARAATRSSAPPSPARTGAGATSTRSRSGSRRSRRRLGGDEGAPAVEALDAVPAGGAVLYAGVGRVAARAHLDRERRGGRAKRVFGAAGRAHD